MSHILELCTSPGKDRLEHYFLDISNTLSKTFKTVRVMGPKSLFSDSPNQGISEYIIKKKSHYLPLKAAKKLAKIIDDKAIDLMHIHWHKDLALAVFAKIFSKHKPKIVLSRQITFPRKENGLYHRFIYKQVDHIITITKIVENDMRREIPLSVQPDISTIYYGVKPLEKANNEVTKKLRSEYVDEDDDFLIGLFGRILHSKGQYLLIEAVKLASQKGYPFKALIVGHTMDDQYLQDLKTLVKKYKLEKQIIFTGFINNPKEIMQACDLILLTSKEETFGLVLIEAMNVGIPVIGSNGGGTPEIIEHNKNGLLFESENALSLFENIETLYHNKKQRERLAEAGRITVQTTFTYEKHIQLITELFNKLLQDSSDS